MATRIKTSCPQCGKSLKVDESLVGKNVRCPACRHRFLLSSVSFSGDGTRDPSLEAVQTMGDGDEATAKQAAPQRSSEPTVGSIGRFEIKSALGGGGFGVVYRAFDPVLGREVALKVPKFGPDDAKRTQRFLIEAQAAAHLHHPNIVAVFESGQAGDKAFIASEYVAGTPLSVRIEEDPPSFQEAALWTRALADALDYAHDEGIIHRDIKPDNIMMAAKNRPQIMDFGLAKRTDEDSSMTGDGSILGTPAYMSPEQARGETDRVGPHSDQYSLGVVLYELLTGKRPFEGPPHTVVAQVAAQEPPAPRKLNARIPEDLEAICQKATEKELSARYADMHAFAEDLTRWLAGRVTKARPIGEVERMRRWCKRNPAIAGLSITVAVLVVAVAILSTVGYVHKTIVLNQTEHELKEAQETIARQSEEALTPWRKPIGNREKHLSAPIKLAQVDLPGPIPAPKKFPNIRRWQLITTVPRGFVNSVAWSPDGGLVAFSDTGNIRICKASNLELVRVLVGHTGVIHSVAWSPDGKWLASGGEDRMVRLWNADGTPGPVLKGHNGWIYSVAWSPDGQRLASGGQDSTVRLWETDGTLGPVLKGTDYSEVRSVAWSPDGRWLVSGGADNKVRLWHPDGTPGPVFEGQNQIFSVAWSPDGRRLASGGYDKKVQLWEADGTAGPVFGSLGSSVSSVDWSRDGKWVASVSGGNKVLLWNADGAPGRILDGRLNHVYSSVAWSPDGRRLASTGGYDTVRLWNADGTPGPVLKGNSRQTFGVAWSPDGQHFAANVGVNYTVRIWNADGRPGPELEGHFGDVICLAWSPDGKRLASGATDATVRLWGADGKLGPMLKGHKWEARAVAWSPDGKHLASGGAGHTVRLWQADGTPGPVLKGHTGMVVSLAWSPDSKRLASGSTDATVRLWDANGKPGTIIKGHKDVVLSMAWRPDGAWLAAAGTRDSTVRLWKIDGTPGPALEGHTDDVHCLAWSPDGKQLASGSRDRTVRLWDPDGRPVRVLKGHSHEIQSLVWGLDGTSLTSWSSDRTMRVWDAETEKTQKIIFLLRFARPVAFDATGELLTGDPDSVEEEFRYVIEEPTGKMNVLKHSEFQARTANSSK
jgi:WD40 repeat protein/DNA-directed RNA polymerase subunit RPC12/RpoP